MENKNVNNLLGKVRHSIKAFIHQIKNILTIRFGKIKGSYIIGLLFFIVFIVFIGNIFKGRAIEYPVVYNTSDGDLYLSDVKVKNKEDAVKLAKSESISNVLYAHTTNRYVLFQKDEKLYLYDAKKRDETIKIVDKVIEYYFTEDDKYIVALDEENNLQVYNYKTSEKIESGVTDILAIRKDKILYEKENKLYIRNVNPKKDDKKKVTEDYDSSVSFSKEGNAILFITNDKELYMYDVKKEKEEKIAGDVSAFYCDTDSCDTLFYLENKDNTKTVYYYNGKNVEKVAKDIYMVHVIDTEKQQVVYSILEDGEYTLYYKKVNKEEVKIEDGLSGIRTVKIFEGKEIYYITGDNEAKYVSIHGAKLGNVKSLGEQVTGYFHLYKKGYAFVGNVEKNSNGNLYVASKGKAVKVDSEVSSSLLTVNQEGSKLYYLKDYSSSGDLYVTSGNKGKKIDSNIYIFEYIKDDLLYYIKDYSMSKSRGDLYRYTGKAKQIAENVTRIANSPVVYELD